MARKKKPDSEKNGSAKAAASKPAAKQPGPENAQFGVLAQFVKDISFESPNAPMSLQSPGENPKLEVNVQVQAIKLSDEVYEVDLMLEAKAESDIGVIYNIELAYATVFQVINIPDDYLKPVLFVDGPTIMFPFLRRVVSDLTRDGGFQPLMLDPIDFGGLFQQNGEQAQIHDPTSASN